MFPAHGTHLQRYASQLTAVEINSSFYRPHRPQTYLRWAQSVPVPFRFSVKVPTLITHVQRLQGCERLLDEFLSQCMALGDSLGCLLVQLPQSFAYDESTATQFFLALRQQYSVLIGTHWYSMFTLLIPVYSFLLLPAIAVLSQDTDGFLERTAKIQWGVMICIYCISHAPALLLLDLKGFTGQNALLLFYLVFVVQLSDVLQYVFGKLFGKHKVAPLVSPSKTVEGLVGGGLSATLIGGCMFWMTPFSFWQSLMMSFVIVVMGFLGGLVMSAIKRSLSAKDWGTMIKGHGGMLDRMDSICFAAPVFFHLTRYFFSAA